MKLSHFLVAQVPAAGGARMRVVAAASSVVLAAGMLTVAVSVAVSSWCSMMRGRNGFVGLRGPCL